MNTLDDRRFDRLVDGELSEAERRELLAGLDNEPGGWRRCALAFLEAQCWKDAFRTLAGQQRPSAAVVQAAPRKRSAWLHRGEKAMALAAMFLVALLLGSWLQQWRTPAGIPAMGGGSQVATAKVPSLPGPGPMLVPPGPASEGPWQMVTLAPSMGTSDDGTPIQLPAMERKNVDDNWVRSVPAAVPDDVLQALHRSGYQVQQRRELVPVPMKDGRRLLVPMDQVEVRYVGNAAY